MSPWSNASIARVPPHPGQAMPVYLRNRQPGDIRLTQAETVCGMKMLKSMKIIPRIPKKINQKRAQKCFSVASCAIAHSGKGGDSCFMLSNSSVRQLSVSLLLLKGGEFMIKFSPKYPKQIL